MFVAGRFAVPFGLRIHARTTGSSGRSGTVYPAALTDGGKRCSGPNALGLAVCSVSSVGSVVCEVWKVSVDTCGWTSGGAGNGDGSELVIVVVGACKVDQGRERVI